MCAIRHRIMTSINITGLNCRGMAKETEWEALMREAKREHVHVLTLQELNAKPEKVAALKARAESVGFHAFVSCSDSPQNRGGTGVLVRHGFAKQPPRGVVCSEGGDTL